MREVVQRGLYYDELEQGVVYRHRPGRTLTEADDVLFSTLTMNHQALHLDAAWAATQPFGQRLVNSMMTLSTLVGLSVGQVTQGTIVANLGFREVEFPRPLFHGDTLYAETEVVEKRLSASRPGQGVVTLEHRGYDQRGQLVARAVRTALFWTRAAHEESTAASGASGTSEASGSAESSSRPAAADHAVAAAEHVSGSRAAAEHVSGSRILPDSGDNRMFGGGLVERGEPAEPVEPSEPAESAESAEGARPSERSAAASSSAPATADHAVAAAEHVPGSRNEPDSGDNRMFGAEPAEPAEPAAAAEPVEPGRNRGDGPVLRGVDEEGAW